MRDEMNAYQFEISNRRDNNFCSQFQFDCVSKRPNILMDICRHFISGSAYMIILSSEMKFHFCQNDRYEINTRSKFQTHMHIKGNIQRVCAYSIRFG